MIKFIDLFAGIGGIRIGAQNALNKYGIDTECVLSSEIDAKQCETYNLNFNEFPEGDIHNITRLYPLISFWRNSLASHFPMLEKEKGLVIQEELYFLK